MGLLFSELIGVRQVCAMKGKTRKAVYGWIKRGLITVRARDEWNRPKFLITEIEAFIPPRRGPRPK